MDVNSRTESGQTTLSYAAASESLDLAKILVDRRRAELLIADVNDMIPLQWAQQRYMWLTSSVF